VTMKIKANCIVMAALAGLAAATSSMSAWAEDGRDLCANRPGRGSPPCVLDAGRFQAEVGLIDFTHDKQGGATEDNTLAGDLAFRYGVTSTGEAELAWSPYVHVRDRDSSGSTTATGYGDLTLAWRQSLKNPAGSGFSVAVQPFVVAPVGKRDFGAGAWQGGVVLPVSVALAGGFGLGLTPQVAVVRNQNHDGSHLDWTGVIGLSHAVGPVSLGTEVYVDYDDDPAGHATTETFDLSAAWTPTALKDVQLDIGLNAGLNRQTPDYEAYAGIARRF
jgi:hypothetical protein